jgi:Uma2 family endonuclease
VISEQLRIPDWVTDQESFRRWMCSDDLPTRGRFCYLGGELWVDFTMERAAHNQVKAEIGIVLGALIKRERLGRYFPDGMLLTNLAAALSTEPDGMFLSRETAESGRATLKGGDDALEVVGTPDMVLEVVSRTSVKKDTVTLRSLYWKAGIPEYWLIEPLGEAPQFEILRHAAGRYVAIRKQGGWARSAVFGKAFKLTRADAEDGASDYTLEVR